MIKHQRLAPSISTVLIALLLGGFSIASAQVRPGDGPTIEQAQAERYDGPKARIAVADFEDKMSSTGQYRAEYGRGMADMLATSLFNTNRYIVLERQKLSYVIAEQDLGASGRVKRQTAAPIGELEGAELLVVANVTGFDPGVSGGGGNLGVIGSLLGGRGGSIGSAIGSLAGGVRTAHIAIDLRLVDTKTGRVVAANSVAGSASDFSGSLGVANTPISGALGGFSKTPMEQAIREVIQNSVNFVVSKTPAQFYRVPASAPAAAPVPELQAAAFPGQPPQPQMGQPAPQTGFAPPSSQPPGFAPQPMGTAVANLPQQPPPAAPASLKSIATDKNPKLVAELTEVKKRGAVVSVVITVRNTASSKERLEYQQSGTHLLDYSDGKKYELVSGIQGKRSTTLGPNEQTVIRAMFKAPPKSDSVAIVIDEIGTFEDVSLNQPSSAAPPQQAPQTRQASPSPMQPVPPAQPPAMAQQSGFPQAGMPQSGYSPQPVAQPAFTQQPAPLPQQPNFPQQGFPAQGVVPQQGMAPQPFGQPAFGAPPPGYPTQQGFGGYSGAPPGGATWSWPPQTQVWPSQTGPMETVAPPDLSAQPVTPGVPSATHAPDWVKPPQGSQPPFIK
jgi:curli biogenesis system outer membrane secretion channel CsgG